MFRSLKPIVTDVPRNARMYMAYLMARTVRMFEWTGLPDDVDARYMEYYLQRTGKCAIIPANGTHYAAYFDWGGPRDAYYCPYTGIVVNPWIPVNHEYDFRTEAVLIRNDSLMRGLQTLLYRYAELLAQADLTLRQSLIYRRGKIVIGSGDDDTRESIRSMLLNLERGRIEPIMSDDLLDTLTISAGMDGGNPTYDMELRQYILASLYHEIGLELNMNNKREYVNSNEQKINATSSGALCDDMLYERERACDLMKERFGWGVTVGFAGEWKRSEEAQEAALEGGEGNAATDEGSTAEPADRGDEDHRSDGD